MSYHDMTAWRGGIGLSPEGLETFLLDQCRCFAASRRTGAVLPLDQAFAALSGLMPQGEACGVFGALHRFVAAVMDAGQPALTWYPPSCRRPSADETLVLALLARLHGLPAGAGSRPVGPAATAAIDAALDLLGGALKAAGLLHEPVLPPPVLAPPVLVSAEIACAA